MDVGEVIRKWRNFLPKCTGLKHVQALQEQNQGFLDQQFDANLAQREDLSHNYSFVPTEDDPVAVQKGIQILEATDKSHRIQGYMRDGQFIGNVLKTFTDGSKEIFVLKKGVRHGYSVSFSRCLTLQWFGLYLNGRAHGTWWEFLDGNCGAFIHCYVRGTSDEQKIFLYPNYSLGYQGIFQDRTMISACLIQVTGIGLNGSVLLPLVKASTISFKSHFTPISSNQGLLICDDPQEQDAFESLTVEVKPSTIPNAGEGLFARKGFEAGDLMAYFNGVRMHIKVAPLSDYALFLEDDWILDIPEELRSLTSYRASLGHKACHAFEPNAEFAFGFHPKFGKIRIVRAIATIQSGQEIFCNYKYSWPKSPEWYKTCLTGHLRSKGKSIDQIQSIIDKLHTSPPSFRH